MLVAAREKAGLSQKDVADQLYLTVTFIRYIDEGAFDKIPKPAFIKGYLRSYARVVGLDGDDIVRRYEEALQAAEERHQIRDVTEETVGSANFTGPVVQTGLVGLFGVLVVVAMVWWIVSSGKETTPPPVVALPEPVAPEGETAEELFGSRQTGSRQTGSKPSGDYDFVLKDAPSPPVGVSGMEVPGTEVPGAGEVEDDTAPEDRSVQSASPASEREIRIERSTQDGVHTITVDAGGSDEIELVYHDDCWTEIEDSQGEPVYGDLNRAGDVLRVYGTSPFRLLLGRATAVALTYNGTVIDLAPYATRDRTAMLTLDEKLTEE